MDDGPVKRLGLGRHADLLPVEPNPIRHPARMVAAAGAVGLLIGAVLPWVDYSVDSVGSSINGIGGETWGIYVVGIAVGLLAALASRWVSDTPVRLIQLVPALLGLASVLVLLNINNETQQIAASYRSQGYQVGFGPGLDALLVASLVSAGGGIAASVVTWQGNPTPRAPTRTAASAEWQGCGDFAVEFAVGVVVCFLCAVAGIVTAVAVTGGSFLTPELAVALAFLGVLVGGILTDKMWRRLHHRR